MYFYIIIINKYIEYMNVVYLFYTLVFIINGLWHAFIYVKHIIIIL